MEQNSNKIVWAGGTRRILTRGMNLGASRLLLLLPTMKAVIPALLCILCNQTISFSQQVFQREKRDNVWLFGRQLLHSRVEFDTDPPLVFPEEFPMRFEAANASICDADGNLLFYSNGVYIANHLHQPMENGMGLNPTNYTAQWANNGLPQPQVLLALPALPPRYWLVHAPIHVEDVPDEYGNRKKIYSLDHSVIDMSENNGEGAVLRKNMPIVEDTLTYGMLTATRHANGRDWWMVLGEYNTNRYYRLLITPDTILNLGLQAIGDTIPSGLGQAVFSPDGAKYARLNLYQLGGDQYIDLYDFDRCSGLLSNPRHFTYRDTALAGGLAFSENSRFLYVSSFRFLYQLDTENDNFQTSFEVISSYLSSPNPSSFFLPQLAPDGKIYISFGGTRQSLSVVHNPNKKGEGCQIVYDGFPLASWNFRTMPNHPYYGLGPWDGSPCDTLGIDNPVPVAAFEYTADSSTTGVEFFDGSFFATAWYWELGDGHTSTARHPVHVYAQGGLYTVCLTASNLTGSHTVCDTVRVEVVSSTAGFGSAGFGSAHPAVRVEIWPNPVQPGVPATLIAENLPAGHRGLSVVEIRDALGRLVLRYSAPVVNGRIRQELDVRGLPAGVYFVHLVSGRGVALGSGKLVVGP